MPPTAVTSSKRFHINQVAWATRVLIYLVTLTFDILTLKLVPVGWATFLPILVFMGLFVFDLWANTCHTHHVTSQP